MISEETLMEKLDMIGRYYKDPIDAEALLYWQDYLNEQLTEDEFLEAVKLAIIHHYRRPTPAQLVELVQGGKQSKALQEWQQVLVASARNDEALLSYASPRTRVALHAVGGLRVVGLADDYKRSHLERQFVDVYCQCSDKDARALPQSSTHSQQKQVKSEPIAEPMPEHVRQKMEAFKRNFGAAKK